MHEIQGHVLPKTKIRRDQSNGFKETSLIDETQLKAAAVARLLMRLQECREDPIKFTEFVMKDPQGRNLILKDFHKDWLNAFQGNNLVVVEASRNHGKTSILVAYLLWRIGRNPNIRIKLFSQNDARAKERLAEIAGNIENNASYHLVFPDIKPKKGQWSNTRINVERPMNLKDATLEALGITTSATGGRVDVIALDDVCDLNNSVVYPTVRERIIQKFTGELLPMLDPGGSVVSIATPYHMCMPDGSDVLTSAGIVPIETVTMSTNLRVNAGNWEPPVAIKRQHFSGDLVCLNVHGLPEEYKFTPAHRLPTQRGDIPVSELTENDYVVLRGQVVNELSLAELTAREPVSVYKPNAFEAQPGWTLNPKFWRFVGYYLAEGCTNKLNGSIRLVFGYSKEELEFVADAADCIKSAFGVPVHVNKTAASNVVTFNCKVILNWLDSNLKYGAANKDLPTWFEQLPKEFLQELIYGYWIGDGSVTSAGTRFATASKNLAYTLGRLLSLRFGISSRIYKRLSRDMTICGVVTTAKESYEVRCRTSDGHTLKLHNAQVKLVQPNNKIIPKDFCTFYKIRKITKENYTGFVTDVQTSTGYFDLPGFTSHNSDLTATLKANPEFKHIRHVIGNEQDPMLPLWPERWDRPALQSLRIQQGAVEFDRAYRCLAFSGETVPCKPEWIKFYTKEELGDPSRMVCIQAYDLAIEQKSTSDYFACVTILYDMERGKAFVADAKHERLSFSSQGHRIIGNFMRWNPDRIIIEKVGLGGSLENYLNENSHIRLPLVPHKPKGDKYFRLMQQLHWLEDGKCTFHPGMDPAKQVLEEGGSLIKELLEFPVGRHDDLVDSLTMALFALEEFRNHEAEAGWYDGGSMKAKMSVIG